MNEPLNRKHARETMERKMRAKEIVVRDLPELLDLLKDQHRQIVRQRERIGRLCKHVKSLEAKLKEQHR